MPVIEKAAGPTVRLAGYPLPAPWATGASMSYDRLRYSGAGVQARSWSLVGRSAPLWCGQAFGPGVVSQPDFSVAINDHDQALMTEEAYEFVTDTLSINGQQYTADSVHAHGIKAWAVELDGWVILASVLEDQDKPMVELESGV